MPTIKAQAVMANSIAVTAIIYHKCICEIRGAGGAASVCAYSKRRHPERRRTSADGGISRGSSLDIAATRQIPRPAGESAGLRNDVMMGWNKTLNTASRRDFRLFRLAPRRATTVFARRPKTDDRQLSHCTRCSLLINFCARFSSDSDQSRRVSAPTLFSTWVM